MTGCVDPSACVSVELSAAIQREDMGYSVMSALFGRFSGMTDGFCECGCGQRTNLAPRTRRGHVKGQPQWFISGHNGRVHSPETRAKMSAAHRGPRHPRWNGGRWEINGYIAVRVPPSHLFAAMRIGAGYVYEHRLVMASSLGRCLSPKEVVHHINGVTSDNRIENLRLFESKAAHVSYHAGV
jgi:hypothetical protein